MDVYNHCNNTGPTDSLSRAAVITFTAIFCTEVAVSVTFILFITVRMIVRQPVGEGRSQQLSRFRVFFFKIRNFSRAQTYVFDKLIGDGIFISTWGLLLLLSYFLPPDRQEPTIGLLDLINSSALAHSVVNHVFMAWQHYRITADPIASRTHPGFTRCSSRSTALTDVTVLWAIAILMGIYYEFQYYFLQVNSGPYGNFIWAAVTSCLYFLLPLIAISSVSLAMVRHNRSELKSQSASSLHTVSSASSMEINHRSRMRRRNATARLARLTWLFLLCWSPYHIALFALPSPYAIRCLGEPSEQTFLVWRSTWAVAYSYFALYPIMLNFDDSFCFKLKRYSIRKTFSFR